jgi:hypothetical protein
VAAARIACRPFICMRSPERVSGEIAQMGIRQRSPRLRMPGGVARWPALRNEARADSFQDRLFRPSHLLRFRTRLWPSLHSLRTCRRSRPRGEVGTIQNTWRRMPKPGLAFSLDAAFNNGSAELIAFGFISPPEAEIAITSGRRRADAGADALRGERLAWWSTPRARTFDGTSDSQDRATTSFSRSVIRNASSL